MCDAAFHAVQMLLSASMLCMRYFHPYCVCVCLSVFALIESLPVMSHLPLVSLIGLYGNNMVRKS